MKREVLGFSSVAVLDKSSASKCAISGWEQRFSDYPGRAQAMDGTSGNATDGIRPVNPLRIKYLSL
jgi:hypothetical protein